MLNNFLKIAFRSFWRNRGFTAINILGLALGAGCSLLIFLWVKDERSVDNFHANGDILYKVYERVYVDGKAQASATPQVLAAELKKVVPEVALASGLAWSFREPFAVGERMHKMQGTRAGVDFFKMFSYKLLHGTPETALNTPHSLAVSRKMAETFFGSTQAAMGKTIRFDNRKDLMVSAVFDDLPAKSTHQFDYLLNWEAWVAEDPLLEKWGANFVQTYIQLRPGADAAKVERKISKFLDAYIPPTTGFRIELGLQRFGEGYLHSDFEEGQPGGGRIEYVKLFSGVAVFVLLIACINYMNLITASSAGRAKEVGVRKVMGSTRWSLFWQFTGESLLLTFFAVFVSVFLVGIALPNFNGLTGKQIALPVFETNFWWGVVSVVVLTGFVAGIYPGLFLSSLQPVKVLKGTLRFDSSAIMLRKGLVVFQFFLSILLIISAMIVSRQTAYLQNKHLGYERSNILYIPLEGELLSKYQVFKQAVSQLPGVKGVDRVSENLHSMESGTSKSVDWEGKDPNVTLSFVPASVGYEFVKLLGLQIVQGRDFSRRFSTDTANFIVNQTAVKHMGLKDPLGKLFSIYGKKGKIIGVLKDFHFSSLHRPIQPLAIDLKEDLNFGTILVRTQAGKTREALAGLEMVCRQLNPNFPFSFSFLDEEYQKLYRNEQVITKLSNLFAILAVFISCLGLLGLAMFSAAQRSREVAIRKVLGASIANIVILLSVGFLKLVALAFVIAAPLAAIGMEKWLAGFAYRIEMSWWMFALAGGLALLVALITISFQAIQSAITNPIEAVKSE